ncbi:signal peptidase II [Candidatus Pacearchaeota archaeon CG06_land_8_20_14_3_00_35_12]|nr:MAG: signal peptidase II [Candidatus Pacearchaeota archaeon CG06_land_8_20_14_3_00_35_12]
MKKRFGYLFMFILAGIIFLVDFITKNYFVNVRGCFLFLCSQPILNKGAAFGILQGFDFLLIAIALIVIVLILYFYGSVSRPMQIALALIFAGTVANTMNRVCLGFVIDFIKFSFIQNSAAFNLADISNIAGAIILLIALFKKKKR